VQPWSKRPETGGRKGSRTPGKEEIDNRGIVQLLKAIIFSFGLLFTALKNRRARSWGYGTGWFRDFVAAYGVPLMVLSWSALSYAVLSKVPNEVPRRLFCPFPWESASWYHWTVIKDMGKVPLLYIHAAFIPSVLIEDSQLYHYANVLAAAVVVNSTVTHGKHPSKHVCHIATDRLNYATMRMLFLVNPPGKATIQVQNIEEFTWLNSSCSPVLK
jgi:hypothetical protein